MISKIIKQIGHFSNAVADMDLNAVQQDYSTLIQEPVDDALLTIIHDILEDTKNGQWKIAKKDALALVEESANRFNDGYGLIHLSHHYSYHQPSEYSDTSTQD